jgi:hypothetical protein
LQTTILHGDSNKYYLERSLRSELSSSSKSSPPVATPLRLSLYRRTQCFLNLELLALPIRQFFLWGRSVTVIYAQEVLQRFLSLLGRTRRDEMIATSTVDAKSVRIFACLILGDFSCFFRDLSWGCNNRVCINRQNIVEVSKDTCKKVSTVQKWQSCTTYVWLVAQQYFRRL